MPELEIKRKSVMKSKEGRVIVSYIMPQLKEMCSTIGEESLISERLYKGIFEASDKEHQELINITHQIYTMALRTWVQKAKRITGV